MLQIRKKTFYVCKKGFMKIATAMKMGGDGNTRVGETKKKKRSTCKIPSLVSISPSFYPILVKTESLLILTP